MKLTDQLFNVELPAETSIKLARAKLDRLAQLIKLIDTVQQITAQLVLRGFRQGGRLRDCELKCLGHASTLPCVTRPARIAVP